MRRRYSPGSHPDTFGERLRGHGTPGACGQFTLYDLRGDSVGAPGVADRYEWPVDELAAACVLDVSADDPIVAGVITPAIGPALTRAGGVHAMVPTPHRDRSFAALQAVRHDATTRWTTAVPLDPVAGQDAAWAILCRCRPAFQVLFSTANVANGILLYTSAGGTSLQIGSGGLATTSSDATPPCGWTVYSGDVRDGGLQTLYANGALVDSDAATAGPWASGLGLGLGSLPSGTLTGQQAWRRLMMWYGTPAQIAECTAAWHLRLAQYVLGLGAATGGTVAHARASIRCGYPTGPADEVFLLSHGAPPAGNAEGLGAGEQIASVTSKNHAFVAGDGAAIMADFDVGLVPAANPVYDATLDAACPDADGLALQCVNPTGGPLVLRLPNAIGGAPATSWGSIRVTRPAGAGAVRLGWSTAAGAFTQILAACALDGARSSGTALPAAATDKIAIEIPAGATTNFVLYCAGIGARVPDEVPSLSAVGVSSTVLQDVYTTTETPAALLGTVELDAVPRLWGTAVPTAAEDLVRSGALNLIRTDGAGNMTTNDGTTTATAAVVEADGVAETLTHAHGDRGLSILQRGGAVSLVAYDGTLSTALTLRGSPRAIRALRVLRNPRWTP